MCIATSLARVASYNLKHHDDDGFWVSVSWWSLSQRPIPGPGLKILWVQSDKLDHTMTTFNMTLERLNLTQRESEHARLSQHESQWLPSPSPTPSRRLVVNITSRAAALPVKVLWVLVWAPGLGSDFDYHQARRAGRSVETGQLGPSPACRAAAGPQPASPEPAALGLR